MADKNILLKKQLIKEAIIAVIILSLLGAGGFALSNYDDSSLTEKQTEDAKNSSMVAEQDSIQKELGTSLEVSEFYNLYIRNHSDNFLLNRETATHLLSSLRGQNHLTDLVVSIAPLSDITPEFGQVKSGIMTKSEIHMTFNAISDNSFYGFIESMQRTFPGIIAFKEIKINRNGDYAGNIVKELSEHKIPPLVNCDVTFYWLGIRPPTDSKSGISHGGAP